MSAAALVVVGAGPAGHAAAAAYRGAGGTGDVVLLAAEGRAPYERPPLSKELLRGEADAAPALEEDGFHARHGIRLLGAEAVRLDAGARELTLADGRVLGFGTCVLATGAEPVRPSLPGSERAHLLRTAGDALALREAAAPGARAVVVGSGFIGCEAAVSLRRRGCAVTLVSQEPAPQHGRLGEDVAARLAAWLAEEGVQTRFGVALRAIDDAVHVSAGAPVPADVVLLALGVRPRAALAADAGLALAPGGEIPADAQARTPLPGVLACGDCARAVHAVAGRPLHVEHWGDALAQGEVAGRTAAGAPAAWDTVPGFWSAIGDRTLKYAAWGDGHDEVRVVEHGDGAFTAWFGKGGTLVGVLAHGRDQDYEQGIGRIARGEGLA